MKKNIIRLNLALSIVSQILTILSGLIIPRLIIQTFGSEVNGLVSSLNQFLSYITLLEGGLGSVVLAGLYKPLVDGNNRKLSAIIKSSDAFFKKLGLIFAGYCVLLGTLYPLLSGTSFSWTYIFALTVILGFSLFCQYFFAITNKLLLRADNKIYVTLIVQIFSTIIVFIGTIILLKLFPNIHAIKGIAALVYIIQPLIYSRYISKNYDIDRNVDPDEKAMLQRWDCLGQNMAYFIHNNTDIAILTIFHNLYLVSVYSVHILAINGIKSLFTTISNVLSPVLGRSIAKGDIEEINERLDVYDYMMSSVSSVGFGCCISLLTSFVSVYTRGVNDTSYYYPLFAVTISLSEYIYCIREPYISVAYSAGKFKETASSAYLEAAINIIVSICLVRHYGLFGVAIGTLCGMLYRYIYQIIYVSKNVAYRPIMKSLKRLVANILIILPGSVILNILLPEADSFIEWGMNAACGLAVYAIITLVISLIFYKDLTILLMKQLSLKRKNK